ncbi:uncharacterized protein LOC118274162 [Spodoptera frugiperda]|uniref:Uncharacterized protein LOC118274162 n=1 Tax=Spodoptera frugiperda TaxID=7108 RepID=A0A9R0DBZ6_SPOFR|nr:uncharacterized protein LOC118274162 [Spodoptera frugiperda]
MSLEDSKIDIIKRRKEATFIADGLDNNASADKIIEYLEDNQKKKNKIYSLYSQTVRQRRTTAGKYRDNKHFLLVGHPLNVFSDDWDGGLNSGYFETFSHKSMLPKMISIIKNIDKKDPVTEYMKKKMIWQDTLIDYKRIMRLMSKKRKYEWINDEVLHCPEQLVEIAAHYEQNPDIYFECSYNWYYAGHGNMLLMNLYGIDYLVHSEFSCLYITLFLKYNLLIEHDTTVTFDCGPGLNILETISSQNIIALRTKHKIFVLKILECDTSIQIEKLKEMDSTLPFTGISFDEYHKNILYVTTLDYKLTIVNIDRMTGRSRQLRGNVSSLVDNWSTVIGSERGYFTHVAKHAITLYDKRTNAAFQRWKNLRNITDDVACNDISVASHATDKRLLYFGTDHHLFLMDLRYNKKEKNKLKVVQRWTHGMQCLPTYMSVRKFDYNRELICLSSQWCEDLCVVSNHADRLTRHTDISSVAMPYRPPSVLQALSEAKEKMLCCDLNNPIEDRLCTSITGLSVLEQDDKYHLLMLNSLGDVSCHTLCPQYMTAFFEDTSAELLSEWGKTYKREPKDLEVSSIEDIRNIWKKLKRVPDDYKLGENKFLKKESKFTEKEIDDAFENEELETGLLDIWTKNPSEETKNESSFSLFFNNDDE